MKSQYKYQVEENLKSFNNKESQRNQQDDYQNEIQQLKIQIKYFIHQDKIDNSNSIIIRHAFAVHNFYKRVYGQDEMKVVYSQGLLDPPLHYFGRQQCQNLKQSLNMIDFSVVYISPMLRSVQTAQLIFNDHPNKNQIKFILIPIACEKVSSQFSFFRWGRLNQLREQIENDEKQIKIDMSAFDEFQNKELWQLEMIAKYSEQNKFDLNSILDENLSIGSQLDQFIEKNLLINGYFRQLENEEGCYRRGQKLRSLMREAAYANRGTQKKVGLISHSVLIKTLYGNGLDHNNKIVKDPNYQLENGNLTYFNLE